MEDCIFCKIVKGEILSHKIYEDDLVYAFLDVKPVSPGHILVIPKDHYENIFDCPENILSQIIKVSKKIAQLLKDKLGVEAVNIFNNSGGVAGQDVFHLHFHVVPRSKKDNMKMGFIGKKDLNINLEEIKNKLVLES